MTSNTPSERNQPRVWLVLAYLVGCFSLAVTLVFLPAFVVDIKGLIDATQEPYYTASLWASAGASAQAIYALWLHTQEKTADNKDELLRYLVAPLIGLFIGLALCLLLEYLLPIIFTHNPPVLADMSAPAIIVVFWLTGFQWEVILGWLKTSLHRTS